MKVYLEEIYVSFLQTVLKCSRSVQNFISMNLKGSINQNNRLYVFVVVNVVAVVVGGQM